MDPSKPVATTMPLKVCIVAPCFNEAAIGPRFLAELEQVLGSLGSPCTILIVDDGSTDGTVGVLSNYKSRAPNVRVEVLALPYNMGHQQAIYQGLLAASEGEYDRFVVMDSDGEDDPQAIPAALAKEASIVLIARGKRQEAWWFKLGYFIYRKLFRLVTSRSMSFGNYSVIDRRILQAVLDKGFTHYAAFLSKQKATTTTLVSDRRARMDGRSKMGFKSLSIHAFKSLIEYGDEVLALLLKGFFGLAVLSSGSIAYILYEKLFTNNAIPGWASTLIASLLNCTLLCLGFFAMGLLLSQTGVRRVGSRRAASVAERPSSDEHS
ncbi:MAG: glycosyltransferase [Flavobacteriales bacterium]|nr:glycosyltransferase [Flavobacteriales bacterium]